MRKHIALLTLAAVLAFPAATFAANSTSDTSESLSVASTISMIAPASATFTADPNTFGVASYTYDATITVISSNNPSGLTVTAKVDTISTGGGVNVATNKRHLQLTDTAGQSGGGPGSGATLDKVAASQGTPFATSNTSVTLATATGPLAGRQFTATYWVAQSEFLIGGTYTSAVHYTATTNP